LIDPSTEFTSHRFALPQLQQSELLRRDKRQHVDAHRYLTHAADLSNSPARTMVCREAGLKDQRGTNE
jgi:hypothetical protein